MVVCASLSQVLDDPAPALAAHLDCNSKTLTEIGNLATPAATELTIASGAITATQLFHTIDTEGDASSDDLDTINGGGSTPQLLFIRQENTGRRIDLTQAGNIFSVGTAQTRLAMTAKGITMLLWEPSVSKWRVVSSELERPDSVTGDSIPRWSGTAARSVLGTGILINNSDKMTVKGVTDTITAAADGATITLNLNLGRVFTTTIDADRAVTASNAATGQEFEWHITQGTGGSRLITSWFGGDGKFAGGAAPTLSTAVGAVDIVRFRYNGTHYRCTGVFLNVS